MEESTHDRAALPRGFRLGRLHLRLSDGRRLERGRKGKSVFDRITHSGGVAPGPNGDTACDFYHRYREDITLMKQLGLKTVRFSVAWTRILPEGKGEVNQKGLDFYERVIDEMLKVGISPLLNFYHFDHPMALQREGGWTNRDMASHFADYCGQVAGRFGDRVKRWMIVNEPTVFSGEVYIRRAGDWQSGLRAMHVVALAQGMAARAIRAATRPESVTTCYSTQAYPGQRERSGPSRGRAGVALLQLLVHRGDPERPISRVPAERRRRAFRHPAG